MKNYVEVNIQCTYIRSEFYKSVKNTKNKLRKVNQNMLKKNIRTK